MATRVARVVVNFMVLTGLRKKDCFKGMLVDGRCWIVLREADRGQERPNYLFLELLAPLADIAISLAPTSLPLALPSPSSLFLFLLLTDAGDIQLFQAVSISNDNEFQAIDIIANLSNWSIATHSQQYHRRCQG